MRVKVEYRQDNQPTQTRTATSLSDGYSKAQLHVCGYHDRSAAVYNRKGQLRIRYWFDGRLQYLCY